MEETLCQQVLNTKPKSQTNKPKLRPLLTEPQRPGSCCHGGSNLPSLKDPTSDSNQESRPTVCEGYPLQTKSTTNSLWLAFESSDHQLYSLSWTPDGDLLALVHYMLSWNLYSFFLKHILDVAGFGLVRYGLISNERDSSELTCKYPWSVQEFFKKKIL